MLTAENPQPKTIIFHNTSVFPGIKVYISFETSRPLSMRHGIAVLDH